MKKTKSYQQSLDKNFYPAIIFLQEYEQLLEHSKQNEEVTFALELSKSKRISKTLKILANPNNEDTYQYVERTIKFLLWSHGGHTLYISGPSFITDKIKEDYSPKGRRSFDLELMEKAFDKTFSVKVVRPQDVPESITVTSDIGGHFKGQRIGFDLGASDYKLSAVKDEEVVFTTEIPWNPVEESDPNYHYEKIVEGIRLAATHLDRIDCIGGSSAGIVIDNQFKKASLFRSVPEKIFETKVKNIFNRIAKEFNVPLVAINDGDVTALAGALSLKKNSLLGIAMGSSEATGFVNNEGKITGQLNELAFAPVDMSPKAATDEWSKDKGVGALYFSQQAVAKLAPLAGLYFAEAIGFPERLRQIQEMADNGNPHAIDIFTTIGTYLGYTLPLYKRFYDFENILILGRVTSGEGGITIIEQAKKILEEKFPKINKEISIFVPNEKERRVGQAMAAAGLPKL